MPPYRIMIIKNGLLNTLTGVQRSNYTHRLCLVFCCGLVMVNFSMCFIFYHRHWCIYTLEWRHYGLDGLSNYQPHHCLLNRLFKRRSNKISKHRVTGLCVGNSPVTGEFPAQMASNAENVSNWLRPHIYDRPSTSEAILRIMDNA